MTNMKNSVFKYHNGHVIKLDLEDYLEFGDRIYPKLRQGYGVITDKFNNAKCVAIHRHVLSYPDGVVDHINYNKLDNRKHNLRVVDKSLNGINKPQLKGRFIGVCNSLDGRFRAYQTWKEKRYELGYYKNELDAARIVNLFRIKIIKEKVMLNNTGDDYENFIPIPDSYWPHFKTLKLIVKKMNNYYVIVNAFNKSHTISKNNNYECALLSLVRFMCILSWLNTNMTVNSCANVMDIN
jgi:hypothetical protein